MREIKFRAWDPIKKKMWYQQYTGQCDGSLDAHLRLTIGTETGKEGRDWWRYFKVMEFTGLKDKNGKEIYEGDIVACRDMHDSNVFGNAWIYKEDGRYEAKPLEIKKDSEGIDWDWPEDIRRHPYWWEVIGNIYQNGDLIK